LVIVYNVCMDVQNAYNQWSESYDSDENLTRDLDQSVTRELLAGSRFDSILEIGCGTGKNTAFLAQVGIDVRAFDFSPGMLAKAREKVRADNVQFSLADLTGRWPAGDGAFDLIVCNLVLEHIQDLSHIFSEAARTLQPGGQFLVNELHPFRQYQGTVARFEREAETVEVAAFVHHISDFINAGLESGLKLLTFNEYWHAKDEGKLPRIVSFVFGK
jgi:ubiquinone/menaquinone biosynthesis C-methylase UbiE